MNKTSLIILILFGLLQSCAHLSNKAQSENEVIKSNSKQNNCFVENEKNHSVEQAISKELVIKLLRTAYQAGCIRTANYLGKKGQFQSCIKDSDKYISEEVDYVFE